MEVKDGREGEEEGKRYEGKGRVRKIRKGRGNRCVPLMLSSGSASGGELTFIASVVNLKVRPHEASGSRFSIRYNFDRF